MAVSDENGDAIRGADDDLDTHNSQVYCSQEWKGKKKEEVTGDQGVDDTHEC